LTNCDSFSAAKIDTENEKKLSLGKKVPQLNSVLKMGVFSDEKER